MAYDASHLSRSVPQKHHGDRYRSTARILLLQRAAIRVKNYGFEVITLQLSQGVSASVRSVLIVSAPRDLYRLDRLVARSISIFRID